MLLKILGLLCHLELLATARPKLASTGLRQTGGGRCSSGMFLMIISVYVPTFRAPRHIKKAFWNDLQMCLAAVPGSDKLLILGDFNVRVHCRLL